MEIIFNINHSVLVTIVVKISCLAIMWLLIVVAWPKLVSMLLRRRRNGRLTTKLRTIHDPNFQKRLYHISTIVEEPPIPPNPSEMNIAELFEEIAVDLNYSQPRNNKIAITRLRSI